MEQKLILHPPIHSPKNGDIIFELTDIQFHTNMRPTGAVDKIIERSVESGEPGRIVFPNKQLNIVENNTVIFSAQIFDQSELVPLIQKYHQQGKRVYLKKPVALPGYLGKDTVEFIRSKKGKRILRRLDKNRE